ncbi:transcriptional regulator, AraC family [Fodinibius roseus]|uniref:Transcriptional regulator, AraC family n=1 Tax=Fodinibius roseus TaxID=1194090 RepID=A0A1M5BH84_9BACT|nr:helix-turn-helix transcriptional regulator [Fodinibius roseus]SHF41789.1 transcriptional regulator, AraC family [Fodinibius roseus]
MAEYEYIPNGPISSYVKFIWISDNYTPASSRERLLPNGSSQLIINMGHQKFRHFDTADSPTEKEYDPAVITGIHTHNIFLDSHSRISTIGAVFRPGALSALFNTPAHAFTNDVISLQDLVGSQVPALRERLIETASAEAQCKLLETFLSRRLDTSFQPNPAVIYSVAQLNNKNGTPRIAEIRDKIGYSRRHFSGLFKQIVGITPKQYAKIRRFQHTLTLMHQRNIRDWAEVALAGGYYDQPHFNRDFKRLSGISPTEYYRNQGDAKNHVPA